ncbi:MAG: hypothetical protein HKM04_09870 [Legionellales bacterium]|nr:hypothetical protein [Legionellales bacterium]
MQVTLCLNSTKPESKTLKKLLARADKTSKWPSQIQAYAHLLDLPDLTFPAAAPLHAAAWEVAGETCFWMHADPVSLTTDQNHAFLTDVVSLTDDEITELLLDINQFLFSDDCVLFAPQSNQWLLNLPQATGMTTTPLQEVLGSDIAEKLPVGANQIHWRRLFTELQMLLYTHPVNEARRKRQLPTVDALWFWGAGPQCSLNSSDWTQIFTNEDQIKGICYLSDTPQDNVPQHCDKITPMEFPDEKYLVFLPESISSAELEENWAKPLWNGLKQKKIQELDILEEGQMYHLNRKKLWRWWR